MKGFNRIQIVIDGVKYKSIAHVEKEFNLPNSRIHTYKLYHGIKIEDAVKKLLEKKLKRKIDVKGTSDCRTNLHFFLYKLKPIDFKLFTRPS